MSGELRVFVFCCIGLWCANNIRYIGIVCSDTAFGTFPTSALRTIHWLPYIEMEKNIWYNVYADCTAANNRTSILD
jgi:hypothetical protein